MQHYVKTKCRYCVYFVLAPMRHVGFFLHFASILPIYKAKCRNVENSSTIGLSGYTMSLHPGVAHTSPPMTSRALSLPRQKKLSVKANKFSFV